jgi:CheY-like chemotaxis protein
LLIEDSSGDALLVHQTLAELPYPIRLSVARDGEQALMILADPDLDAALIILDLNIPKVSGEAVLERNPRKDIPVVIFSVSSDPSAMQRALDLGAREYLVKPMDAVRTLCDFRDLRSCCGTVLWHRPFLDHSDHGGFVSLHIHQIASIRRCRPLLVYFAAFAAQAGHPHDLQILIEYRLAGSDGHVLDATELMQAHQLHQGTLSRAQVLSPQRRSEPWGRL